MEYNYTKLANIIKNARIKKGITQRQLGEMIGLSHTEIVRFENGLKPSISTVPFIKMCQVLDLDLIDLVTDVGLYELKEDKLFYVMFKNKNTNIFKVHAKNEIEAVKIAVDIVCENELIELDKSLKNVLIGCAENLEDFDDAVVDYFDKNNRLPENYYETR